MTVPSNPKDRESLKAALVEITDTMTMMDSLKEKKKDIVDMIKETYELTPKTINKMAKTMYDRSYQTLQQENEDFELLYESVVEGASVDSDEA